MAASLNFTDRICAGNENQKIQRYQYHSYPPTNKDILNIGNSNTIISIPTQNVILDTVNSNIVISGRVTCPGVALSADDYSKIQFIRNGYLHLFSQIKYYLCDKLVSTVDDPGYNILIKNLLISDKTPKLEGWDNEKLIDSGGYFSIEIPLNQLFSLFETYNKPILYVSQKIELLRNLDDSNCFYIEDDALKTKLGDNKIKVELDNIIWKIPHIDLYPEKLISINNMIASDATLTVPYKDWCYSRLENINTTSNKFEWNITSRVMRPLFAMFCFSTDKHMDIKKDNSTFDFCDLVNIKVHLNSESFPDEDLNLNLSNNEYSTAYNMYTNAKKSYLKVTPHSYFVNKADFRHKYPIFIIDTSYRNNTVKDVVLTLRATFTFKNNAPANTAIHCIIVNETFIIYNPGSNLVRSEH